MRSIPGVAARTFGVIGETSVNVLMIAQGSSELNLSLVVEEKDVAEAVRSIHDAFELGVA
jgi:aspartokinase